MSTFLIFFFLKLCPIFANIYKILNLFFFFFGLISGKLQSGLPPFQLPPFHTQLLNQTFDFTAMCTELGSSIVLVPVIAVLGNVAIAKAFGKIIFHFYPVITVIYHANNVFFSQIFSQW